MTDDSEGLCAAAAAYEEVWPSHAVHQDAFINACRAYHRHMISATPDLRVHEANGTIRLPVEADL